MRQNENFMLRCCADLTLLVPVGEAALRFPGMISVNETGAFLWEALSRDQTPESLTELLTQRFQVSPDRAARDTEVFLDKLARAGALADEERDG